MNHQQYSPLGEYSNEPAWLCLGRQAISEVRPISSSRKHQISAMPNGSDRFVRQALRNVAYDSQSCLPGHDRQIGQDFLVLFDQAERPDRKRRGKKDKSVLSSVIHIMKCDPN